MSKTMASTRQKKLKALARKLGYSNSSYLSQMATGYRPISEKTARKIEGALSLSAGYVSRFILAFAIFCC